MGEVVSVYKQFDPEPGSVWQSSYDNDDPTVYYFVEKQPPSAPSVRFGSSHHTWKVIILEGGSLGKLWPVCVEGSMINAQFDGVSTGYGPPGREHDEGCDSGENCYKRIA
jgi:hypothetical protein